MPTILTNTNSNDSPSIASDRSSTTEPRGPHTSAPAAANQSNKDDSESSHTSVDNAPPVMPDNLETDNAPHSGASAIDDESYASPQGNTPLTPVHDALHHTTGENHGRPTQAGIDPGASQAGALEAHFKAADVKGEDNVTKNQDHTCGCQSQKLTGWAAVEKTLTDFDREEVGGYKEDIDSLLTFAGLYSGVLTAFVIVSFTQLSEDTATESLRVLRIIANQTSTNPVSPSLTLTDPSPFQPSVAAKRVNILWFASLVISLSTASFSILVKQWLRSYLAFASSSPQGALRIRHFRRAGLEAWRVFAIASMLPFLLQISLALFFVGLCFFTADLNPTIGNTTVPLVCAWAFLFIAVTLSPIFSANCPYKTPAVSPVTTVLRRYVGLTLRRWGREIATFLLLLSISCLNHIVGRVIPGIKEIFTGPELLDSRLSIRLNDLYENTARVRVEGSKSVPLEEADMRIRESEDLAILITADAAIQANIEPDLIMLEAALKQSNPSWEETVVFLLQIIGNRVPLPVSTDLTTRMQLPLNMIDCSSLSARARENIVTLLQRYVIDHLPDTTDLAIAEQQRPHALDASDPLTRKSVLLVWAMVIHTSFHDRYARFTETLLASVDRAIYYYCFQVACSDWWRRSHLHQIALATCYRITHDNIRAGCTNTILLAIDVLSFYSCAMTRHNRDTKLVSLLAITFRDAARCLANNLEQELETMEPEHTLSAMHFEKAIRLVMLLCALSQHCQNGDEIWNITGGSYEMLLAPLVIGAFNPSRNSRSWRAKAAILNVLCPVRTRYFDDAVRLRYCLFLRDILNSETPDALNVILQFAAMPINENDWKDIIGRSSVIIRILVSTSQECESQPGWTNRVLWRRIFFVLTRQMHSLAHISSVQDFLKSTINLPKTESVYGLRFYSGSCSLPDLVKYHCGKEIDKLHSLQSTSNNDVGLPNISERLQLEHQDGLSYIPDYFCFTLGRLADFESSRSSIWTAKHLSDISTEERDRIVEEEEREMEAIGIDAIIAEARQSYIE